LGKILESLVGYSAYFLSKHLHEVGKESFSKKQS
jgi:hypothetical protein